MSSVKLKKILKREVAGIITKLTQDYTEPVWIEDPDGNLLWGMKQDTDCQQQHRIVLNDTQLGTVFGPEKASSVAELVSCFAVRENEKKALSKETLEKYKEINLLYSLSAKVAKCLEPGDIANLILSEVEKLIVSTSASLMLFHEETGYLEIVAAHGLESQNKILLKPGEGIAGNVFSSARGDIFNDAQSSPWFVPSENIISSLICIPLTVEDRTIGVLNISNDKPITYSAADLKFASALASQAAVSIENARLYARQAERNKIEQELEIARNIQQSMLPGKPPGTKGFDIAAAALPAKQIGGDFYDFISLPENKLGLVIADVSGKGVPAALFMVLSRALMRANALQELSISATVEKTNHLIHDFSSSGYFVTLFYAIADRDKSTLQYVRAGHNLPVLYRPSTDEMIFLKGAGIALGVLDEIELETQQIELKEGDILLLFTDGATEAINPSHEEFGLDRLCETLKNNHHLDANILIENITNEINQFAGSEPQFDDLTLMALKVI